MKRVAPFYLVSTAIALILPACAPAVIKPITGRIVNVQTGQEGIVLFKRGTLQPQLADPYAPNNTTIRIGNLTYTGRTKVIDHGGGPLPVGWGLSVEFEGSNHSKPRATVGWRGRTSNKSTGRIGNLIAKTNGRLPITIACQLTLDLNEHGIGECKSSSGNLYSIQF